MGLPGMQDLGYKEHKRTMGSGGSGCRTELQDELTLLYMMESKLLITHPAHSLFQNATPYSPYSSSV